MKFYLTPQTVSETGQFHIWFEILMFLPYQVQSLFFITSTVTVVEWPAILFALGHHEFSTKNSMSQKSFRLGQTWNVDHTTKSQLIWTSCLCFSIFPIHLSHCCQSDLSKTQIWPYHIYSQNLSIFLIKPSMIWSCLPF